MKFEYLANRVEIMLVLRQESGRVMDDTHITIAVDGSGHVSIVGATGFEEYRRRVDILIEEMEVARWERVGPEDSEPFLTDEWMERTRELRAPLSSGRGWERLPLPEALSPDCDHKWRKFYPDGEFESYDPEQHQVDDNGTGDYYRMVCKHCGQTKPQEVSDADDAGASRIGGSEA